MVNRMKSVRSPKGVEKGPLLEMAREGSAHTKEASFLLRKAETTELWHRRMGHGKYENLAKRCKRTSSRESGRNRVRSER